MIKRTLVTIALLAIGFFISLGYSALLPNNQFVNAIPSPKQEYEERGRSVVELLSSQTTT